MSSSFGIYFGNTTIVLAGYKDGKTEVVTNDSGDRMTPAIVAFNQNEFTTGLAAKNSLTHNATGVIVNNKRFLDDQLTESDLEDLIKKIPSCSITQKNNSVVFNLNQGGRSLNVTPEDILMQLFKRMFSIASNITHTTSNIKVVISTPVHFSQNSRQLIWSAADNAGFTVLQIISEPAAAALAYELGETSENVLIYRLGGITCDATVLKVQNGLYSIVKTIHDPNLGGNYFTKLLADYIAKEFMNRWKLDPQESKKSMNKLMRQAELSKHILSTKTSTSIFIESLCDGVDWEQNMTRPRFENLISPHLQKYINPIKNVLTQANLKADDITKLIFCGGSTRIPKLQSTVVALIPNAMIFDDKPDEIIAEGCARQSSLLETAWDSDCAHLYMDVPLLSKDVYICDKNKHVKAHIPSMTPLPTKINFSDTANENDEYNFIVIEGSLEDKEDVLDEFTFPNNGLTDFQAHITQDKIVIEAC